MLRPVVRTLDLNYHTSARQVHCIEVVVPSVFAHLFCTRLSELELKGEGRGEEERRKGTQKGKRRAGGLKKEGELVLKKEMGKGNRRGKGDVGLRSVGRGRGKGRGAEEENKREEEERRGEV